MGDIRSPTQHDSLPYVLRKEKRKKKSGCDHRGKNKKKNRGEFGIFLFVRFIIYMHVLFRGEKGGGREGGGMGLGLAV